MKFTFENPEIIYENENKVQVLNFLDVKIILHEDNSVETHIYYQILTTTYHTIAHTLIILFVSNPEKVIIHLDELRQSLKECKCPEHVIRKSIFNAKRHGPAANPERNQNVTLFVTTYYPNINNKSLMKTVKNKFKNIKNEHFKSIYKDTNLVLSLKQPKRFYRKLTSSRFISSFGNRKPGSYKSSDKKCKICQNYLNQNNKFTCQMVKFGKLTEKLTATQSMLFII